MNHLERLHANLAAYRADPKRQLERERVERLSELGIGRNSYEKMRELTAEIPIRVFNVMRNALREFHYVETKADLAKLCAEFDAQWWLAWPNFGKVSFRILADFVKAQGFEIKGADEAINGRVSEIAALKRALNLAINMLAPLEPGDSRAVSDEFVALAAVACGDYSPEVMEIIERPRDPASFSAAPVNLEIVEA